MTKESLIKGNPHAMELLMEAMEYHLLPERRAELDQERTRPRSKGNKTQVCGNMGLCVCVCVCVCVVLKDTAKVRTPPSVKLFPYA